MPSKLSEDESKVTEWLSDQRGWKDGIFSAKPYDYLKILVMNKIPVWSKEKKGYISTDELEAEQNNNGNDFDTPTDEAVLGGALVEQESATNPTQTSPIVEQPSDRNLEDDTPNYNVSSIDTSFTQDDDDDDDLPF